MNRLYARCGLIALFAGTATSALAEMSAEELAKLAQNPVGNLISVPFQNNTNLNFGPEKGTQNILNIQPVIPISISDDWNIITRTILPVIWQPALGPDDSAVSGIGDLQFGLSVASQARRVDLGRGPHRAGPYTKQCQTRQRQLGRRAVVRRAASRQG
jgi:hypothetical protein